MCFVVSIRAGLDAGVDPVEIPLRMNLDEIVDVVSGRPRMWKATVSTGGGGRGIRCGIPRRIPHDPLREQGG